MTTSTRIRKKTRTAGSIESSSSVATARSKQPKGVLELGEYLVEELGLVESNDTLARWLAHHLAYLIEEAKTAKTAQERRTAAKRAADTILKIWEHRVRLPGDAYPLARYRQILQVLDQLNPLSDRGGYGSGQKNNLIIGLPRYFNLVVLGIILLDCKLEESDNKYEEIVDRFLEMREAKLLGTLRIVVRDFAAEEQKEEGMQLTTEEKLRAKTVELIDRATADLGTLKKRILQKPTAGTA